MRTVTNNIKAKQEFSGIPDTYVQNLITETISEKELVALEEHSHVEKSELYKTLFKEVRKKLHETYGVFQLQTKKRTAFLNALAKETTKTKKINEKIIDLHQELLATHQSSKERRTDYSFIYGEVKKRIGTFKSILDISAGLNPLSWIYYGNHVEYYATELSHDDVKFLNAYFKIMKKFGIQGKAVQMNLLAIENLPETDVCFVFKVLDNLETLKFNESKELLKNIPAKNIVVSFPKVTISGKNISTKRLKWFHKLLKEKNTFETWNEIFYVIKN